MKKFIVLIMAMLFLLASCKQEEVTPNEETEVIEAATQEQENSLAFLNYNSNTSSDFGYYYTHYNNNEDGNSYVNMRYIDYETQTDLALCSRPECTHDNDTCTAFIDGVLPNFTIFNDKMYLLYTGVPEGKDGEVHIPEPTYIASRDLSGQNEQIVYTYDIDAEVTSVAMNEEFIFSMITQNEFVLHENGDSEMYSKVYMEKLNISTGEKEIVLENQYEEKIANADVVGGKGSVALSGVLSTRMVGIVGDSIIYAQTNINEELTGEETPEEQSRKYDAMTTVFSAYNTITGETIELIEVAQNISYNVMLIDGALYYNEYGYISALIENKFLVNKVDCVTVEKNVYDLSSIFAEYESENANSNISIQSQSMNGLMVSYNQEITTLDENGLENYFLENTLFLVDLENITGKELTLTYEDTHPYAEAGEVFLRNVTPMAKNEDYFLAQTGNENEIINVEIEEGVYFESIIITPQYSLILQEDYYNNVPNYLPINRIS